LRERRFLFFVFLADRARPLRGVLVQPFGVGLAERIDEAIDGVAVGGHERASSRSSCGLQVVLTASMLAPFPRFSVGL